jgi:hypothetical protein
VVAGCQGVRGKHWHRGVVWVRYGERKGGGYIWKGVRSEGDIEGKGFQCSGLDKKLEKYFIQNIKYIKESSKKKISKK